MPAAATEAQTCRKCGTSKPLPEFSRSRKAKSGHATQCKACSRIANTAWNRAHRAALNEAQRRYYANHRPAIRAKAKEHTAQNPAQHAATKRKTRLKTFYGLSLEDFEAMLAEQDGKCAICRREGNFGGKRLAIDHDHATGAVRGLLCHRCNHMLGHAKDDPERLRAAALYLEAANGSA